MEPIWQELKAAVLTRDRLVCSKCGWSRAAELLTACYCDPAGRRELANLETICAGCLLAAAAGPGPL